TKNSIEIDNLSNQEESADDSSEYDIVKCEGLGRKLVNNLCVCKEEDGFLPNDKNGSDCVLEVRNRLSKNPTPKPRVDIVNQDIMENLPGKKTIQDNEEIPSTNQIQSKIEDNLDEHNNDLVSSEIELLPHDYANEQDNQRKITKTPSNKRIYIYAGITVAVIFAIICLCIVAFYILKNKNKKNAKNSFKSEVSVDYSEHFIANESDALAPEYRILN
ncbi:MAG: hypothetical protein MHPSP_003620, partial [Paramarteilia canceri]